MGMICTAVLRSRKIALNAILMAAALVALEFTSVAAQAADPLPSWNDGPAKQSIISFVEKVTKQGSPDFVPVGERIATFDNDGTLWCEQPVPVQLYFALDRVKALAPQHPEWNNKEPFASLLKGDLQTALAGGDHALLEIVMATHAGMTTVEFEKIVQDWIATAKHPKTGQLFTDMAYQPMLEVLSYLRATASRTSSFLVVASNSCAHGRSGFMASRRNRSLAPASRRNLKCATANRSSCVCRN
jgi:hypothetical protein